ncbi:MAG: BTAD domain-containing putative transcriptional regulator [Anaerolineae bacterium]
MAATIHVRLLGVPQVERDGEPVRGLRSRKALALLGYLAVQERPIPRAHLAELLWAGLDEARGRANLSWVLHRITTLMPNCLTADRQSVALRRHSSYWLDIDALGAMEAKGSRDALTAAVELYRGPFLEGIQLQGCAEFEIWLAGERERWAQRLADALHTLIAQYARSGEYDKGLHFSRRLLALEPWRERTHRQMMELLARSGRWSSALAQYQSCRRILADELGVEPTEQTRALYERIRTARRRPRHNLPPQPNPFIGRRREAAAVIRLLDNPDCRLLTLHGPGGVGKTRLALRVASTQSDAFLEGVWFVPLTSLSSASSLVSAIANALEISFSGRKDAQAELMDHLRGKEMLLILDSFEHLLNASDLLVQILEEAPEIKLLVTSRAFLNLSWEWRYEVKGLEYPSGAEPDQRELEAYDALALFQEVARRVSPHWPVTGCGSQAIARICRLVEGMPLAIELAAASTRTHPCEEIAEQVENNLGFLRASLEDVPARHRSVRAALDHSWGLLEPDQQETLVKLSTFRSGFQKKAARHVADASPYMLQSLADKSLLRILPSGRCEMHDLVRRYASARLSTAPSLHAACRAKHAAHYLALLQRLDGDPGHLDTARTLATLRADLANVRAAWRWAVRQINLEEIQRSLPSLSRFYTLAGPYQEATTLISMAVDHLQAAQHVEMDETERHAGSVSGVFGPALTDLLAEQARFLNRQGCYDEAIEAARAAITISETAHPQDRSPAAEASAYLQWGNALVRQGAYGAAQAQLRRALILSNDLSLHQLRAASLHSIGNAYHGDGDYVRAADFYRQALWLNRQLGDRRSEGALLASLGLTAQQQGAYHEARTRYEQALRAARETGDRWGESLALINLGYVLDQQGAYADAEPPYRECLHIAREIGDRQGESMALACLGLLFHHLRDDHAASRFSEQAVAIAQDIGDRRVQGYALTRLGHALLSLGRLEQADEIYRQAISLRRELGERGRLIESQAGLARTQLARRDLTSARRLVAEILRDLDAGALNDTDEPFRIYLTCYQVLRACGDSRADSVLEHAHDLLRSQAANIEDQELHHSFLTQVASHRELIDQYQTRRRAR